jgi:hypothetical protein
MEKFFNRFIPIISSLVIFGLLIQIARLPQQIYLYGSFAVGIVFLTVWQITGRKLFSEKFWRFLITPAILIVGGLYFYIFLEGKNLQWLSVGVITIMLWSYFEVIVLRFHFRPRYQPHSLENISSHLNLIAIFMTASGLFGQKIFLGISIWWCLAFIVLTTALLTYQLVLTSGASLAGGWMYIAVITLIISQLFWAVSFLPTSMYVNALLITIGYYLMSGLVRNWLLEIKEKKVIARYVITAVLATVITLATAKWF